MARGADERDGRVLRFLGSLALIPYALRGVGAIIIMLLVGIAAVSALLLWIT